jgi:uncharacterized protein YbjT (DUF2867 family)
MIMQKTALVFGATGLIGSHLIKQLSNDERYGKIIAFSRSALTPLPEKVDNQLIDFEKLGETASLITGDEIFCCLGTTIEKAKTREAFRKVDLDYPLQIANIGKRNGVSHYLVISSIGANPKTGNFYLQTKGLMEEGLRKAGLPRISILRPSMLLGKRNEFRWGEEIGKGFIWLTGFLLAGNLKKYRGIHASVVARAMIRIANGDYGKEIYESDKIAIIGKQARENKRK